MATQGDFSKSGQYVGARYVPKFYQNSQNPTSNDWEGNVGYEALTIVTYLGSSYTSKITVPAGIGSPPQNPTYWALTGNYNAQVQEYRKAVDEVQSDLEAETQSRINGDNAVQANVNTNANGIQNALRQGLNPKNRYFILLGDSFGQGWTPEATYTSYLKLAMNFLNVPSSNYQIIANGGAGFGVPGNTPLDLLKKATLNNSLVTDIIWCGGRNEYGKNSDTIYQNAQNFFNYARENYPNSKIGIGFVGYSFQNSIVWNDIGTTIRYYTIITQLGGYSMPNLYYALLNKSFFSESDSVHPNEKGHLHLATALANAIMGQDFDLPQNYFNQVTFIENVTGNIAQFVQGGMCNIWGNVTIHPGTGYDVSNTTNVYGTINNPLINFSSLSAITSAPIILSVTSTGNYYLGKAYIRINANNELIISLEVVDDAHRSYVNDTVKTGSIQFSITVPAA